MKSKEKISSMKRMRFDGIYNGKEAEVGHGGGCPYRYIYIYVCTYNIYIYIDLFIYLYLYRRVHTYVCLTFLP